MPVQFFTNYIELLKDDEYHDITIEVGEDPDVKLFRAHKNILCYRSSYLRQILSSNKENNNVSTRIKLPNVLPEIFQTILEYIYGGILSLNEETLDFIKILDAADNLHLQELIDYLQKYLIEDKPEWIEQNFGLTHQISSKSNNLLELQEYCSNIMAQYPEKIFNSFDFILLSEDSLVSLIKRDDLQMKEIEVWEQVVKWGLAQNPTLTLDPKTCLSSREFSQKVRPYQKLLDQQQYEELLSSYLDPDRKEEIFCGYNPLKWESTNSYYGKTADRNMHIKNIISKVKDKNYAIFYKYEHGPQFGGDIVMSSSNEFKDYEKISYQQDDYERKLIDSEGEFSMEDYEVFQIIKK
ncbi:BTB/POZ protein [Rhizophagus irregularis DAOM 181602=DAOM 197198]|nr:BTB/POZ protein [Rhizophagus irregularis DAOM 181602=DAOM 197198]